MSFARAIHGEGRGGKQSLLETVRGGPLPIFTLLLLLYFVFGVASPGYAFFSAQSIQNIFTDAAELLLLATGTAYVLIAGEIDLSIGSGLALASVVAARVTLALAPSTEVTWAILAGCAGAMATGVIVGILNGVIATFAKIPSFLVTLGTLSVALGAAELLSKGSDIAGLPVGLQTDFGTASLGPIPDVVLLSCVVCLAAGAVLRLTAFGRHTYAIGSHKGAAVRAGLPVRRHIIVVFGLMGLLAGLAGFVDVARFGTTNVNGHTTDPLAAIVAAAIGGVSIYGGRGKMAGVLAGVLIPTVIEDGLVVLGVSPFWQTVAVGWLVIAVVGVDIRQRDGGTVVPARLRGGKSANTGGSGGRRVMTDDGQTPAKDHEDIGEAVQR